MIEAACAIIIHQGKILCAQRSETMRHPMKWEFPGGKIEAGESAEACIIREIREELSININVNQLISESIFDYGNNYQVKLYAFICNLNTEMPVCSEHKQLQWLKIENLMELDWVEGDYPVIEALKIYTL